MLRQKAGGTHERAGQVVFTQTLIKLVLLSLFLPVMSELYAQSQASLPVLVPVATGWANNSVNTVIFRKNSLVTFRSEQYIAFYNAQQQVVIGKRKIGSKKWILRTSKYKGNANDAHRSISIMVDGEGYLHMAWNHHDNPLHYAKSISAGSLEFGPETAMTGSLEKRVTYPEFYRLPNGDLLFFYRSGMSGEGNLVINRYNLKTHSWTQLHHNLIDGEGQRSAYWQAAVDKKGTIHLSWVWRESPDVASNHDLAYAKSEDGGLTWKKSDDSIYQLPITAASAEYAQRIPKNSELINQTSMTTDAAGHPYIATYWRDSGSRIPQYHIVFQNAGKWQSRSLGFLNRRFSLSGTGTKQIPISRPQVFAWQGQKSGGLVTHIGLLFRSAEMGNKVAVAYMNDVNDTTSLWKIRTLSDQDEAAWEPSFDTELWKSRSRMDVFIQRTPQADHEGKTVTPPQMVSVLSFYPEKLLK